MGVSFERPKKDLSPVLEYKATVADPRSFTRAWTMAVPLVRDDSRIFEYACHEGNYGLGNILSAAFKNRQGEGAKK
jgi:hypothetical protein